MIEAMWRKYWCECLLQCWRHIVHCEGNVVLFWDLSVPVEVRGNWSTSGIRDQVPWPSSQWTWDVKLRSCLFVPGSELFSVYSIWLSCFTQWLPQKKAEPWCLDQSETALKVGSSAELVCQSGAISCFRWFGTVKTIPAEGSKKGRDRDVQNSWPAKIVLE